MNALLTPAGYALHHLLAVCLRICLAGLTLESAMADATSCQEGEDRSRPSQDTRPRSDGVARLGGCSRVGYSACIRDSEELCWDNEHP